jgi:hypothetical protein
MKSRVLFLQFSAILWFGCLAASAQTNASAIRMETMPHPRLLLLKGEEAAILKTIANDATWKNVHSAILRECDAMLAQPPVERIVTGRRLLGISREALRRIFNLSYAWRMTKEAKYRQRAERELLAVSAFEDWHPSHFLDVAEMTMAAAIGYDWLFDTLSASSREIVKNAILEKGLQPSLKPKNNSWLRNSNNWNQVCNAGMTYGAIAVFEVWPELAAQLLDRAADSIKLPMEDYSPDGAYPEGYGYWGYGTSFNVLYVTALEKILGKDFDFSDRPAFLKTAGFLENMTGPTGNCFNFSDSGAGGGLHPAMFWFANRLRDPTLLWSEKKYLSGNFRAGDRLLPAIMIWGAGLKIDKITPPAKTMWVGGGQNPVSLMRTSWTDPNAIYVGMKGGTPKASHAHMDVGSFVMEADGVRWAMDFGPQNYHSLESKGVSLWNRSQKSQRWEIFRYNNLVHNTLTVNGQLQLVDGHAPITSSSDNAPMMNAIADLSQVYRDQLHKASRGIAIVDKQYVAVRDEVETLAEKTVIRWTMLTAAEVKITGNDSAELTKSGKKLILHVAEPAGITVKTWSTDPTHDYDAPNPGTTLVGFEAAVPANTKAVLQVFLLPRGAIPNPSTLPGTLSDWTK